jgi:hypothetical protein
MPTRRGFTPGRDLCKQCRHKPGESRSEHTDLVSWDVTESRPGVLQLDRQWVRRAIDPWRTKHLSPTEDLFDSCVYEIQTGVMSVD